MRTVLFSILFVGLYSFELNAQPRKERIRVRQYYDLINEAELMLIDSNYNKALAIYKSAFSKKFPNDKDLYNAFILSYFTRSEVLCRKYLLQLAFLGMDRSLFPDTTQDPKFHKLISSGFDSSYNAGGKSKIFTYAMQLREIGKEDQVVRKEVAQNPKLKNDRDFQGRLKRSDSIILSQITQFILKNGFPSFERKGFWDGSSPNNPSIIFWIIYHQRPNSTSIDKMVYKAVLDGDYRPDEWATLISYRDDERDYCYNIRFWKPLSTVVKDSSAVEASRSIIYLEPINDFKRKWHVARRVQDQKRQSYLINKSISKSDLLSNIFLMNFFILPTDQEIKLGM